MILILICTEITHFIQILTLVLLSITLYEYIHEAQEMFVLHLIIALKEH